MKQQQVEKFLDEHSSPEGLPQETEQSAPRAPFISGMRLTRNQEDELVAHAFERLADLEREHGRVLTSGSDWYSSLDGADLDLASRSYLGKRQLFKLIYQNKMNFRPYLLGGIFKESNLVVPIARRIVRQMVARASRYFFGSDPWFSAHGVGQNDKVAAKQLQRFAEWKFTEGGITADMTTALENTFVKGEQVVKINHKVDDDFYTSTASVMVDEEGNAYLDSEGGYIYDTDRWSADPESGSWVMDRDPSIARPENFTWRDVETKKRAVHYEGPEIKPIHERDFLFPLTAEDIHQADCVVHLYDMPVMDLVDYYQRRDMLGSDEEKREATEKAIALIRGLAESRGTHSAQMKNLPEVEESLDQGGDEENKSPMAKIAEFHMTFDVDGDGILEKFMLVVERDTKLPIFYDFTAELTPDGKRPFEMMRINPVPGRAYGIGGIEMFESTQNIIDLLVNRMNHSQSRAGRIDLWRPYNTVEGDRDPSLKLNWGQTYTPKPGIPDSEILSSVYLRDVKSNELKELSEYFSQMAMNESGIQHANDNLVSGLHSTQLATGIRNIEAVGNEMFSLYITHLRPQVTKIVKRGVYCLLYYMREEEPFMYFEGDNAITEYIAMPDTADFDVNVRILMTQERNERILESNAQAEALLERFRAKPTEFQAMDAPMLLEQLQAMQITTADQVAVPGPQYLPGTPAMPEPAPEEQGPPQPTL